MELARRLGLALVLFIPVLVLAPPDAAQAAEEGAYVRSDTKKEPYTGKPTPWSRTTIENFSAGNAEILKWDQLNSQGKPVQLIRTTHTWSTPPKLVVPQREYSSELTLRLNVLKTENPLGVLTHTSMRIDAAVFSTKRDVTVNWKPGTGASPHGRTFKHVAKWKAGAGHKQFHIQFRAQHGASGVATWTYIYTWNPKAKVPATPPTSMPPETQPPARGGTDISGVWVHGPGGETWTFTPQGDGRYKAVEKGFANATGTATVRGNVIHIEYTIRGGTGTYDITLEPSGTRGEGVSTNSLGQKDRRTFTKQPGKTDATHRPPEPGGMTLRTESRSVASGGTVTVPVWLEEAAAVANANFALTYDPSVVRAERVVKGGFVANSMLFEANPKDAGTVRIGFAGSKDLGGSGPVAHVVFRAVGQPGTKTALQLGVTTLASAAGSRPAVRTVDGSIAVLTEDGQHPGDANGNGVLDAGDALEALKMSVKLIPEKKHCDLDKDGAVTSTDARLILQKVVGK